LAHRRGVHTALPVHDPFPIPRPVERLKVWKNAFPEAVTLTEEVSLERIARKYGLTGAGIMNVVQNPTKKGGLSYVYTLWILLDDEAVAYFDTLEPV
jgi:hypothetical protein